MAPPDDSSKDLRAHVAENLRRVEEMLRFLPVPEATSRDLREKVALLRAVLFEHRPPALALVGRRGAGKSSLVNAIFGEKLAEVGHVRAQTGRGCWYDHHGALGTVSVLDTRGVQEGSKPAEDDDEGEAVRSVMFELAKKPPDVVLFLVKATEVDSAIDGDLDALERVMGEVERVHRFRPPILAVATHCDVLEPKNVRLHRPDDEPRDDLEEKWLRVAEVERVLEAHVRARPKLAPGLVLVRGVSTYLSFRADGTVRGDERWRIEELLRGVYEHLPDAGRGAFVRVARVRGLQEDLAITLTRATAALSAGVAAVPIPVADLIPLTSLQVGLVATIAWLSGRELDAKAAGEFLGAMGVNVGAAFVLREAARALGKIVFPGAGSMISGAVAFAGTMGVGSAARAYFLRGAALDEAREAFERGRSEGRREAEAVDRNRPPGSA